MSPEKGTKPGLGIRTSHCVLRILPDSFISALEGTGSSQSVTKISVQWTIIYCILVYFNILQWLQDLVSPCINMYQLNINQIVIRSQPASQMWVIWDPLRSMALSLSSPSPNLDPQRLANLMAFSRAPVSCRLMAVRRRDSTSSICGFSCTAWRFWLCNAMYSLYIQKTSITQ